MSLELMNTTASLATFLVIAATAIAALVQLRHLRSNNQIAAMNELMEVQHSAEFKAARHFCHTQLPDLLKDPAFRYQLVAFANKERVSSEVENQIANASMVADYYENLGLLVKRGFIDRETTLDSWAYMLQAEWQRLAPVILRFRRGAGNALWENFEYVVVLAKAFKAANPNGTYPARMERIQFSDEWAETDRQYAARTCS
jgi:hypothetical protein